MSVTLDFTKRLPKVELHAHLSGSVSRECLHEIWLQRKATEPGLSLEDPLVAIPEGKVDFDIKTFFPLFSTTIHHLLTTRPALHTSTLSVLHSFHADNTVYLELRTTPRAIPSSHITKADHISLVLDSIASFSASTNNEMPTYLILSIDRANNTAEAMEIVDLAIRYRSRGVVGIDLCGDPAEGDVAIYGPAFARAKQHGMKLTLHFAEVASSPSSLEEELRTLLSYNPDRIGHVIHVPDAIRQEIAARELPLELCLSCNVHAKLTSGGFAGHHFGEWRDQGCPIVLCTDDVGIFCSPLSNEYLLAATHFGLRRREVVGLCEGAIEAVFGGEAEKERLRGLVAGFVDAEGEGRGGDEVDVEI